MKYCFLILSALFIVSSCKKVDVPKSNEEILRESKWKIDLDGEHGILVEKNKVSLLNEKSIDTLYSLVVDGATDGMLNDTVYNRHYFPQCQSDDYFVFRDGITGAINTGDLKCPQGEVVETDIEWGFMNNYSTMFLYGAGNLLLGNDDIRGQVKEFTDSRFVIQYMTIDNTSDIPKKDTTYYTVAFKKR